jgi:ribose 5-phosphate isomerase A
MTLKEQAAIAAAGLAESGMILGLGTGSTAALVVKELGRRVRDGELRDVRGVPTSEATARLARAEGLPLLTLEEAPALDLTIDGADEIDPAWNLVKGAGGSLLREKIVAQVSRAEAIVADDTKLVARLGGRMPLPLEVVPFGWNTHLSFLQELGGAPTLRRRADGAPFITDEGNWTIDCRFSDETGQRLLENPAALDELLRSRAGIIETGFFLGLATILVVARDSGVEVLRRDA